MSTECYSIEDLAELSIELKTTKYAGKVDDLSSQDYEKLKKSIADNGLFYPVTINQNGDVLDGHHRLRACQELGIPPQIAVVAKPFESEDKEELFVIDSNLARRQLNTFQACELALKKKHIFARIAEEHMKAGKTLSQNEERVHTDKELARSIQKSTGTFYKAEQMLQAEQQDPDGYAAKLVEESRRGKISVNKAYHKIRKAQALTKKKAELAQAAEKLGQLLPNKKIKLFNRDMREPIAELLEDSSVDLIITDPPYSRDSLDLYGALASFAARKLKPGGSLVFYYGRHFLPEVMKIFAKHEGTLNYAWEFAVKHNGNGARFHPLGIWPRWKPMLWFTKGEESRLTMIHREKDMEDIIESKPPDKDKHPWAQSPVEAEFFIRNLTLDHNAIVVDPFLGSGAFGIAAAKLGRHFVGIEIDKDTFDKAELTMAQALTWPPPPPLKKEE